MTPRENKLRAVRFEKPECIPLSVGINIACWDYYGREQLAEVVSRHPRLFPGFTGPPEGPLEDRVQPWRKPGVAYTDSWGCVWRTAELGITGAVVKHPLDDWEALDDYTSPDPNRQNGWGPIDWDAIRRRFEQARQNGRLRAADLRHGHTFLTLSYIRGYENLLFDMVDEDPRLWRLIEMVERFNATLVQRYLDCGAEWMGYPEDLGMQRGPMLSPDQFRKYILPTYQRLIAPAKAAGCVVHVHSDGDVRDLTDDLLTLGIDVLNIQDLVNGIDWMAERLKGRVCIDLDVDRQQITRFGSPGEIDAHIRNAVETLASPEGGLTMMFGLYPGAPLENIDALFTAFERYCLQGAG